MQDILDCSTYSATVRTAYCLASTLKATRPDHYAEIEALQAIITRANQRLCALCPLPEEFPAWASAKNVKVADWNPTGVALLEGEAAAALGDLEAALQSLHVIQDA